MGRASDIDCSRQAEIDCDDARFVIDESRGNHAKKVRLIDDLRISGINDVVTMSDTEIPQDLDAF